MHHQQQLALTSRQQELYDYLHNRINNGQGLPSLRQAAADLNISHSAVASLLHSLEEKCWIQREGRYSRNITLLKPDFISTASGMRRVPIIGRVAAGLPLYAQQEWAGTVLVDANIFRGNNIFGLRVQGDSMQKVGILDGDLAICEPRQFATNGEIVVALINNEEATIKRFFYQGDHIKLQPENDSYPEMIYGLGEVLIQGKVVGIQRGPEQMAAL